MDEFLTGVERLKTLFLRVGELGALAVGFIVLIYLLLGENSGDFVIGVIANISVMVNVLTPNVLIGAALVLFLLGIVKQKH
jgi:hypothetical protein